MLTQDTFEIVTISNPADVELRDYQDQSIECLRIGIRDGKKNQVLCSPTGSGKSVLATFLLKECYAKNRRAIFVAERLSLIHQFSTMLDNYGLPHGVIQSGHWRYRPDENIQIASAQTLAKRGWPMTDLIIIDEAHVMMKNTLARISKRDCTTIGLTATPFSRGMGKHYDGVVNVTTTNKLTEEGYLVPFKVWSAKEPDMSKCKAVAGEWTDTDASRESMKIIGDVVHEYSTKGSGGKFIAFGVDVAHCEALQRQFLGSGIRAELYTYKSVDEERKMHMEEFRKPDSSIKGLISVSALSRGLDVPDVSVIITCRPLKSSLAEHIQVIGRGLRPYPGKEFCTVLDLAGNCYRHWPAMQEFFQEGVNELDDGKKKESKPKVKAEKKPVKCPKCKFVFAGGPNCPACGYIFPPKKTVEHERGELMTFDGQSVLKLDRDAKSTLYAELKFIAEESGYKIGWAAWKYKAITGVWPNGFKDVESQIPRRDTLAMVDKLRPTRPNRRALEPRRELVDLFA